MHIINRNRRRTLKSFTLIVNNSSSMLSGILPSLCIARRQFDVWPPGGSASLRRVFREVERRGCEQFDEWLFANTSRDTIQLSRTDGYRRNEWKQSVHVKQNWNTTETTRFDWVSDNRQPQCFVSLWFRFDFACIFILLELYKFRHFSVTVNWLTFSKSHTFRITGGDII